MNLDFHLFSLCLILNKFHLRLKFKVFEVFKIILDLVIHLKSLFRSVILSIHSLSILQLHFNSFAKVQRNCNLSISLNQAT